MLKTLTVGQLKNLLEGEDENLPVIFSTDYGDYHRTPQALPLRGELEEVGVEKSAYSNSRYAVIDEETLEERIESGEPGKADDTRYLLIK